MTTESKSVSRFREFVRQRRALLPRKEKGGPEVYEAASLRQVLEQVGLEMAAGIAHDYAEVASFVALANTMAEQKQAKAARPKPRFRGLGR